MEHTWSRGALKAAVVEDTSSAGPREGAVFRRQRPYLEGREAGHEASKPPHDNQPPCLSRMLHRLGASAPLKLNQPICGRPCNALGP